MPILYMSSGCFSTAMVDLHRCDRSCMAHRAESTYYLAIREEVCQPLVRGVGFCVLLPGFESCLQHLLTVCPEQVLLKLQFPNL